MTGAAAIDLYVMPVAPEADPRGILPLLDHAEQKRAARYRRVQDRLSYIAAHALLRVMLGHRLGVEPPALRFSSRPGGKPVLESGFETIPFSLSHSAGVVAVALGCDVELGVDIEVSPRPRPAGRYAASAFCPDETAMIHGVVEDVARERLFLQFWTLKEAFAKATGRGLSGGLDRVSFAAGPDRPVFHSADDGPTSEWKFAQWSTTDHVLALAARGRDMPRAVQLHVLDEDALRSAPPASR
ncbi:4'-phosphopantetheinyl transferase family protein [Terrihabitans rhizophilus]|uniref:4'-phosphopantetheinyl transferase superfamily protein n=1 Tax=Terrihabitans rhizophilus TaxID=3092662 RepID=A0ABU4RVT9_9HYPH|nr:4'-phosphopantetheinyl transferase superfamily protein [Terrihabitans sp. PJ23]MDX6806986.1 4'-phosphopantetheinyl transferase superfamily protein [Terrihabitans sp. PJ23]